MHATLRARVHYLDLGGLFHWTRKQLKLDRKFQRAGLTAIIGMGCSPGITNVMARYAAEQFERVESIRIRVGARELGKTGLQAGSTFVFPYSAQTVVEELTLSPWLFRAEKFRQVRPRTGWERVDFPRPVGTLWTVCTRHSEIATLPLNFRLKHCDFKVSFDRSFVREVVRRLGAGWTIHEFAKLPAPRAKPNDYEIARIVVTGVVAARSEGGIGEGGRARRARLQITIDCHAKAKPRWHASAGDMDTGCPPSIVAQMISEGAIARRGVFAPEVAIPMQRFFRELQRRGMKIVRKERHL